MIRLATLADIAQVAAIYADIHQQEELGNTTTGWKRGLYPTEQTARDALAAGTLFVYEEGGQILASARIDQHQEEEYAQASWTQDAPPAKVMVLHTLVVSPAAGGRGIARQFVAFYEEYAARNGCPFLRMDTNARNTRARALYHKLGYREVGIVACNFHSVGQVDLVCLEKTLKPEGE